MNIGLFFGSFNPIHTGHLIIANYMLDYTLLEEIWFVVSPQNPFKVNESLLNETKRLQLVQNAIAGRSDFKAIDIEFKLSKPSYTTDTLNALRKQHPEHVFTLIIGGDNLQSFHQWKDYNEILQFHEVFVYARTGIVEIPLLINHPKIKLFEVPLLNISSTYIRESIKTGKSIKYLVPDSVLEEITSHGYYQ